MDRYRQLSTRLWAVIGLLAAATTLAMAHAGLTLSPKGAALPLLACLGTAALGVFYQRIRPDERLAVTLDAVAQLIAFSAIAGASSYVVATWADPLWDASLYAWDGALGLDWRAYLAWVNAHPRLGLSFSIAYQSMMFQIVVICVGLGFTGQFAACQRFILAFVLAAVATVLVSGFMPAMGAYDFLNLQPADYPRLTPVDSFAHIPDLIALRAHALRTISLTGLQGVVSFPSFHAALGVILCAASWTLRSWRWPSLALNALMIASTPIEGGHYFVDTFAGAALALLSVGAAQFLCSPGARPVRLARAPEPGLSDLAVSRAPESFP